MAGRVRTLADVIAEFTREVRALREALPHLDKSKLDAEAARIVSSFTAALDRFNSQLGETNQNLRTLARTPMLGLLGGGAESAIESLARGLDQVRDEASAWRRLVS